MKESSFLFRYAVNYSDPYTGCFSYTDSRVLSTLALTSGLHLTCHACSILVNFKHSVLYSTWWFVKRATSTCLACSTDRLHAGHAYFYAAQKQRTRADTQCTVLNFKYSRIVPSLKLIFYLRFITVMFPPGYSSINRNAEVRRCANTF